MRQCLGDLMPAFPESTVIAEMDGSCGKQLVLQSLRPRCQMRVPDGVVVAVIVSDPADELVVSHLDFRAESILYTLGCDPVAVVNRRGGRRCNVKIGATKYVLHEGSYPSPVISYLSSWTVHSKSIQR